MKRTRTNSFFILPPSSFILRPAFSLIELLVVIAIIMLLLGLAIPAFKLISGSKSQDAAINQIGGMLGMARNEAIANAAPRGVMFFPDADPSSATFGRYVGVLVQPAGFSGFPPISGATTSYQVGDYSIEPAGGGSFPNTTYWLCIQANPSAMNYPMTSDGFWTQVDQYAIDIVPDSDSIALPAGVGMQLVNDCKLDASNNRLNDGYLRCGAIMFDSAGRLMHRQISIWGPGYNPSASPSDPKANAGLLGHRMGLGAAGTDKGYPDPTLTPPVVLNSQFGFVVYDLDLLKNVTGVDSSQNNDSQGPPDFSYPGLTPQAYSPNEMNEENWLDANAVPVLVNRYNGTLIKAE